MAPKTLPGGLVQITLRIPPDVLDYFENAATVEMSEHPGRIVTRADLMRQVLTAYAEQRKPARGLRKGGKSR